MTNNELLLTLLRLIAARAAGQIGGPAVDAKIADLEARLTAAGRIVDGVLLP